MIGLSTQLDVFYMALAILSVLVFSWGGVLDVATVPALVRLSKSNNQQKFLELSSALFWASLCFSCLLAVLIFAFGFLFAHVAFGFTGDQKQMVTQALKWLAPMILLYLPYRQLGAVLRSQRRFSKFYQAEFISGLTIAMLLVFFRESENILIWSLNIGVAVAFIYLLTFAWPAVNKPSDRLLTIVQPVIGMIPGLFLFYATAYIFILSDRVFVSFLAEGSVSAITYAITLVTIVPGIFSVSSSFITVISEKDQANERKESFDSILSLAIFFGVPSVAVFWILGDVIVRVLLERGEFTSADTQQVYLAIAVYAPIVIPLFLQPLIDQIYQVENKIGLLVKRNIFGIVLNCVLNAYFLFGLKLGLFGIALATTISFWVVMILGLIKLSSINYTIDWVRHFRWLAWVLLFQIISWTTVRMFTIWGVLGSSSAMISGLLSLLAVCLAGFFYRGAEGKLFRDVLQRIGLTRSQSTD